MKINVEVAYANKEQQQSVPILLPKGSTVLEAIVASNIVVLFPELAVGGVSALHDRLGIFGEKVLLNTPLAEGDRVEIYRALKINPKEARVQRAKNERKQAKQREQLKNIEKKRLKKIIKSIPSSPRDHV